MAWTRFMDMHSGGSNKIDDKEYIYIELPMDEAINYFENRFGRSPYNVTCHCCGIDFSLDEAATLAEATSYDRNCRYDEKLGYVEEPGRSGQYITVEEYSMKNDVLLISAKDLSK